MVTARRSPDRNRWKFSSSTVLKGIQIVVLVAVAVVANVTWRLVRLAHETMPDQEGHQRLHPQQSTSTASTISFLPPLPKIDPIPPHSLVQQWMRHPGNETAGQFLLDFAIIGNAKCGTSTLMEWFAVSSSIQIPRDELYHLKSKEAWDLVGVFYEYFGKGKLLPHSIKGYKSPSDITNERAILVADVFSSHQIDDWLAPSRVDDGKFLQFSHSKWLRLAALTKPKLSQLGQSIRRELFAGRLSCVAHVLGTNQLDVARRVDIDAAADTETNPKANTQGQQSHCRR